MFKTVAVVFAAMLALAFAAPQPQPQPQPAPKPSNLYPLVYTYPSYSTQYQFSAPAYPTVYTAPAYPAAYPPLIVN